MQKLPTMIFPLLLVLYEMAAYLSVDMYLPALPQVAQDLHVSQYAVGLTITLWLIGEAIVYLPLGLIADRYGRRTLLLSGGVIFVIASLVCALADNISLLLIARFIQGATVCSVLIAGYASVHQLYSGKEAIIILAWMASITMLAPAFGPLLGSIVLLIADWRVIFWVLSIWVTIVLVFLYYLMPETNPITARKPINIVTALQDYALIIKEPHFVINTLIVCCIMAGIIIWITVSAFLIIGEFGTTETTYGLIQVGVFGSLVIGAQAVKFLITRMSSNKVVHIGLTIIFCGSLSMLLLVLLFPNLLFGLILSLMLYTGGMGLIFAPLQRLAIEASAAPMGAKIAIFFATFIFFAVLGSALASVFYQGTLISLAVPIAALGMLACILNWYKLSHEKSSMSG